MKNIKWVVELIAIILIFFFLRRIVHLIGSADFSNFISGFLLNILVCTGFLFFAVYQLTNLRKTKLKNIWSLLKFKFLLNDIWLVLLLVIANSVFYAAINKLKFLRVFSYTEVLGRPEFSGYQAIILLVLIVVFITVVVFSEELYFRVYLFNVQFHEFKKYTWIVNGFAWSFFHIPTSTNFIALLPICFLYSYIYQQRRNIWITIIAHVITNSIVMIPAIRISINQI